MFDPYFDWLQIARNQRPPSPFALLGIPASETDAEAIADAAMLRILQIGAHKKGPHAADYARLVREIHEARDILSNPAKREQYARNPASFQTRVPAPAPPAKEEAPVDLADEETEAAPSPAAWWDDPAARKAIASDPPKAPPKADWWKETVPSGRLPEPTSPVTPALPTKPVGPRPAISGFEEFGIKPRTKPAPPKKKGKAGIVAAVLLIGGGAGGYFAWKTFDKPAENSIAVKPPDTETVKPKVGEEKGKAEPVPHRPAEKIEPKPDEGEKAMPAEKTVAVPVPKAVPVFATEVRKVHAEAVRVVAVRRDGSAALSAGDDMTVFLHRPEAAAGKKLIKLEEPARAAIFFPSGKRVAVTEGGTITVIDTESGSVTHRLVNPRGGVRCLQVTPDEQAVLTGNTAGDVNFWTLADGQLAATINFSAGESVISLALAPNGQLLAAGLSDGTIQAIDAKDRKKLNKWKASAKNKGIAQLGWSADGLTLFSLGEDNEVAGWNPATGQKAQSIVGKDTILAIRPSSPAGQLYAAGAERGFLTAPLPLKKFEEAATALPKKPYALDATEAGDLAVLGLGDGLVQFLRLKPAEVVLEEVPGEVALAPVPDRPLPVPDAGETKAAFDALRQKESVSFATADAGAIRLAAARYARLAETMGKKPAERSALFAAARQLYEKALDVEAAFHCIALQARWFEVDRLAETTAVLAEMEVPANLVPALLLKCNALLAEAEEADRYDLIRRLIPKAERLRKFCPAPEPVEAFEKIKGRLNAGMLEKEAAEEAKAKLAADPEDKASGTVLGKFLVARKRLYAEGLALLAKGDDDALRRLAERDLADPKENKACLELGNEWWQIGLVAGAFTAANAGVDDFVKASCWIRAKHWYDRVDASGNDKLELLNKIAQINDLLRRLASAAPAPKAAFVKVLPTVPSPAPRGAVATIAGEAAFAAHWTASGGVRLETDGVRYTRGDGVLASKFLLDDNWKIVIFGMPGAAGFRVAVHGEELSLPGGVGKAAATYTVERKGTKLSFAVAGANPKSKLPASGTILLSPERNAATPITVAPAGQLPAEGILLKSIALTGTTKPVPKE